MKNMYEKVKELSKDLLFVVYTTLTHRGIQIIAPLLEKKTLTLLHRRPPLWSSSQSFWLQIQRYRVRFPALPDFLSSSGSATGSTQPREVN